MNNTVPTAVYRTGGLASIVAGLLMISGFALHPPAKTPRSAQTRSGCLLTRYCGWHSRWRSPAGSRSILRRRSKRAASALRAWWSSSSGRALRRGSSAVTSPL